MSSHGGSGASSRELMGQGVDVWQYVRDLEARMARMEKEHENKLSTVQTEVTTLRAQLAQQHAQNTQQ
jgi:rubrerythrin